MSVSNILQQINTIPNPGGIGLPVQQYAQTLQSALTKSLESVSQNQISTLDSTQSALTSLQSALAQFQSATETLASSATWNSVTATSSNTAGVSVTSNPGASPSTYSISIGNLAANQVNFALSGQQTSANGTSTLTGGTLDIIPMSTGSTLSISVTSGESLDAIAQAVNAASTLVQASVVDTGSSSAPYDLVFQSTQTGLQSAFTLVDGSGSNLVSSQLNVGSATQTAKNAVATLDGSILVQSSTNTFSNAIPDVSFTANQAGANATITVASSSSSTVTAVQTWMSAYNSVVDLLNTDTSYTPATSNSAAQSGPLFADANASGLISALPSTAEALVGSGTAYQDLAAIGIIVNPQNGHLGFQSSSDFTSGAVIQSGQTLFTNALQTNSSAVQSLFGVVTGTTDSTAIPTSGVLGNVYKVVNSFGTSSGSGTIGDELTSIGKQVGFLNSYLTQVNQQIQDQVNAFASQLQQLNTVMAHTQAQMQTVLALIGGSASSSSSSGSSSSSSTIP